VHVAHLSLLDFRSYPAAEIALEPGVVSFLGRNGEGKTNLLEAIQFVATQDSHRVASSTPLVRHDASRAVVRADVVRAGRHALVEIEINPGKSSRARLNRATVPRAREVLGVLRTVLFAPEDLAIVKGDPAQRRTLLDDLLVVRAPRLAGVRWDYDRVLKQRTSLLKSARAALRGSCDPGALGTLDVWDAHLARSGAELLEARLALVDELRPLVAAAYVSVAGGSLSAGVHAALTYRPSFELSEGLHDREALGELLLSELQRRRGEELDRGLCLVGPHRDDLVLSLGDLPAKGYASQGESWSFALALRLAAYDLLRAEGDTPVLLLDDVFAELDVERRARLAELVSTADQVLVTAAVEADVPEQLKGVRFMIEAGEVSRAD
jgi:DNA replication and repair protein RecF